MPELAVSMCFSQHPFTIVDFPSYVGKDSFAMRLAEVPLTVINCAIVELDPTITMSEATKPLALINSLTELKRMFSVLKFLFRTYLQVDELVTLLCECLVIIGVLKIDHLLQLAGFVSF